MTAACWRSVKTRAVTPPPVSWFLELSVRLTASVAMTASCGRRARCVVSQSENATSLSSARAPPPTAPPTSSCRTANPARTAPPTAMEESAPACAPSARCCGDPMLPALRLCVFHPLTNKEANMETVVSWPTAPTSPVEALTCTVGGSSVRGGGSAPCWAPMQRS